MPLRLSTAAQRQLAEALRALASPVGESSVEHWRRKGAELARAAAGTDTAVLVLPAKAGLSVSASAVDPETLSEYEAFFPLLARTGVVERGARAGVGARRTLYGPYVEEMMRSEYVQEFLASIRSFDAVSIVVPVAARVREMSDAAQLTLSLTRPDRAVTERHLAIARLLRPAFEVGVRAHAALGRARAQLRAAVDATGAACLVADRGGRVRHRSPALESLLGQEPEREALVDQAARAARSYWTDAPQVRSTFSGERASYALAATEVADGPEAFCVVVVTPLALRPPAEARRRFGLTNRQAEVAGMLAERRTNREIASALASSVHTARHHVEAVLAALGVPRADVGRVLRGG